MANSKSFSKFSKTKSSTSYFSDNSSSDEEELSDEEFSDNSSSDNSSSSTDLKYDWFVYVILYFENPNFKFNILF